MLKRTYLFSLFILTLCLLKVLAISAAEYYVSSSSGNDSNPGSLLAPWKTIQHAADTAVAGDTVYIRAGTYSERIEIKNSGDSEHGYITFKNYKGEKPCIDGSSLSPETEDSALIVIYNKSYIIIEGLEIGNYQTSDNTQFPNGNVENFTVSNNIIHDCNNIGIDAIGWEGTAKENDQVRNGSITDNTIYNITSYGNPAYGTERSAGGIYVDGGKEIVIERNTVHSCDIGIEVGCEHRGKTTSDITVRDNILYENNIAGIAFGGYSTKVGSVNGCVFEHNTLFHNDTQKSSNGEILIQIAHDNSIKNNIINANEQNLFLSNYFSSAYSYKNTFDYNVYYAAAGEGDAVFIFQNSEYNSWSEYRTKTGCDLNSLFGEPKFKNTASSPPDFRIKPTSPAVNAGDPNFTSDNNETDIGGENRVYGSRTDCGAYEYNETTNTVNLTVSIYPENSGIVNGAGEYNVGTTGYSQITAKYPKLRQNETPTGYIILKNSIAITCYKLSSQ